MIANFRHQGLRCLYRDGHTALIDQRLHERILTRLDFLNRATEPEDLNIPSFGFHSLRGRPKRYALFLTANWRVTFEWDGENVTHVNLEDYH